jgi:hypothetical protein
MTRQLTVEQIEERRDSAQSIIDASPEGPNIVLDGLRETVEICNLALDSLHSQPAGGRWVPPLEPTAEMAKAGGHWWEATLHNSHSPEYNASVIYAAMLAAAMKESS